MAAQVGLLQHVGQAPVAAPVIGHRPAAVRDDEAQGGEVGEQVALQELHEGGGVGVDVVGAGGVEGRITGARNVDHRRDVEFDHLLVEGIPGPVGQGRRRPVAARGVGVEVAADEAELQDGAFQLGDRVGDRHVPGLRQLGDADEGLGKQADDPGDQVVAAAGPFLAHRLVADVVGHGRGARREDGHVGAALGQQAELVALDAGADLVVGNLGVGRGGRAGLEGGDLGLAPIVMGLGRGGVVPVAIDDHGRTPDALIALTLAG